MPTNVTCPVCERVPKLGELQCSQCGWELESDYVLGRLTHAEAMAYQEQLQVAQQAWQQRPPPELIYVPAPGEELTVTHENGILTARWRWPAGIETVTVALRTDLFPAGPEDSRATLVHYSRHTYEREGGFRYTIPPADQLYLAVYSAVREGEQWLYTLITQRPWEAGRHCTVRYQIIQKSRRLRWRMGGEANARVSTLTLLTKTRSFAQKIEEFFVRQRWSFFSGQFQDGLRKKHGILPLGFGKTGEYELVITPDAETTLPALLLVAKPGGVPLRPENGTTILCVLKNVRCSPENPLRTFFLLEGPRNKWKFRLFPLDERACDWLDLRPEYSSGAALRRWL